MTPTSSLTCNEVLARPDVVKLPLTELQTIPPSEIVKCIANLSNYKLNTDEADFLWQSIKKHFKGAQYVPPGVLMWLRWVTPAISPEEYTDMTLGDIDVIQNFGLDYKLTEAQLSAIANRVRSDFSGKKPEDYTYYDLMAMRNILCAFNRSEIERIHPLAYSETALMIGKLKYCSEDVLTGFATLASQPDAFGPPKYWDNDVTTILGKVMRYVFKDTVYKTVIKRKRNRTQPHRHFG